MIFFEECKRKILAHRIGFEPTFSTPATDTAFEAQPGYRCMINKRKLNEKNLIMFNMRDVINKLQESTKLNEHTNIYTDQAKRLLDQANIIRKQFDKSCSIPAGFTIIPFCHPPRYERGGRGFDSLMRRTSYTEVKSLLC